MLVTFSAATLEALAPIAVAVQHPIFSGRVPQERTGLRTGTVQRLPLNQACIFDLLLSASMALAAIAAAVAFISVAVDHLWHENLVRKGLH